MATGNAVHVDECHSDRLAGITFENWGHISPAEFTRKREKVNLILCQMNLEKVSFSSMNF